MKSVKWSENITRGWPDTDMCVVIFFKCYSCANVVCTRFSPFQKLQVCVLHAMCVDYCCFVVEKNHMVNPHH